jgi:hypothetical protein
MKMELIMKIVLMKLLMNQFVNLQDQWEILLEFFLGKIILIIINNFLKNQHKKI